MSTAHITEFINAVNAEFLKGKKLDELTALWKRISTVPKCPALVKAGTREGQACGKSCVKGQEFCLCHIPREPIAPRHACIVVLKAGKRQGQHCGKPCMFGSICVSHSALVMKNPCVFVMRSGEREGQPCGMTCAEGTICKKHARMASVASVSSVSSVSSEVVSASASETDSVTDSVTESVIHSDVVEQPTEPVVTFVAASNVSDVSESSAVAPIVSSVSEKQVCGSVLKSGANKGKPCGKLCGTGLTVCASHK
jgi:hypothetical protein